MTKTYRVKDVPKPFGGRLAGDLVELTEAEAVGFLDKVELVELVIDDETPQQSPVKKRAKTE
jgi:hypothetical protein